MIKINGVVVRADAEPAAESITLEMLDDDVVAELGGVALASTDPVALGAAAPGNGTTAARANHVHPTTGLLLTTNRSDAAAQALGAAAAGTSANVSRADHVHPTAGLPTLAAENDFAQRQIFSGGALVNAGQVLTMQAASNSAAIQSPGGGYASARSVTMADASGVMVLDTAAQTLTNKTLTTPTLTGYTVATLPAGGDRQVAYATDGRKAGEGAGLGTGVPVYFSGGSWRVFGTDAAVTT